MTMTPAEKINGVDATIADVRRLIMQTERRIESEASDELLNLYEQWLDEMKAGLSRLMVKRDVLKANGGAA